MNRAYFLIGFFLLLLVLPLSVSASAAETKNTALKASITAVKSTPLEEVLPLSVHTSSSLSSISVSQQAAEKVFEREKASYSKIQSQSLNTPASEKSAIQSQLSQQRYRVLIAILNRVIIVYQRIDYLISNLDVSLLRLRAQYIERKGGKGISDFDVRMKKLETQLALLHVQSKKVADSLEKVKDSASMVESLRSSRNDVSILLQSLRVFLEDYRALVTDVVRAPQ